jgi:regulator of protease activity HflC (stomatin/prohibitin superfamily)
MEYNDIMRRRRTPVSSSYRRDLLPQDHQIKTYHNLDENGEIRRNHYQPPVVQQEISHRPPEATSDHFLDHPTFYEQQRRLLYLTSPQPPSIRRTIVSQTPSRTTTYNSLNDSLNNIKQRNPAEDLGANSLFSYGFMCCQCVRTTEVGIVENFGKYVSLLGPGFYCLPWPCTDISGRLSIRINQLEVVCESKTSDSVFCTIAVTVPFRIITERGYDAYYRLTDPRSQIKTLVFDVVRACVPKMTLDEVFQSKSTIANQVSKHLKTVMEYYGYEIFKALVTDVKPADAVRQAMNEINASKRLKIAMVYLADAEMTRIRKNAEAHAEELYLQGVGVSGQRQAIVKGLVSSLDAVENHGISNAEVMNLLLVTQYNDLLQAVSLNKTNTSNFVLPLL